MEHFKRNPHSKKWSNQRSRPGLIQPLQTTSPIQAIRQAYGFGGFDKRHLSAINERDDVEKENTERDEFPALEVITEMSDNERTMTLQKEHVEERSSIYGKTSLQKSAEFPSHSDWTENENETSDLTLPTGVSQFLSLLESKDLGESVETFDETTDVSIETSRHPDDCSPLRASTGVTFIDGSGLFAESCKNSTLINNSIPLNIAACWIPSDISDIYSASTSKLEKKGGKQIQELSTENKPPMHVSSIVAGKRIHRLGSTSLPKQNLPLDILQSPPVPTTSICIQDPDVERTVISQSNTEMLKSFTSLSQEQNEDLPAVPAPISIIEKPVVPQCCIESLPFTTNVPVEVKLFHSTVKQGTPGPDILLD